MSRFNLWILAALLAVPLGAAAQNPPNTVNCNMVQTMAPVPQTPNNHLYIPAPGTPNWAPYLNCNFDILDYLTSGNLQMPGLNVGGTATFNNVVITGTCTGSCGGGGGSMTWPTGGAGIPNYSGSQSWGTTYLPLGTGTVVPLYSGAAPTAGHFPSFDASGNLVDSTQPGTGNITGTVTVNTIPVATAPTVLGNSQLTDDLTTLTYNGSGGMVLAGTGASTIFYTPGLFAGLPTCNSGAQGTTSDVSDSSTTNWGATITGGGAGKVMAYCNGTNWTVMGAAGSGGGILLKTDGVNNGSQTILNLKHGTNVTIADDGVGGITINSTAGGSGTVSNCGTGTALALYAASGTTVSCNTHTLLTTGGSLTTDGGFGLLQGTSVAIQANTVIRESPSSVQASGYNVQEPTNEPSGTNTAYYVSTNPATHKWGMTFGALPIAAGGTGQVTAPTAFNALAPVPTRAGDILYYDGANWTSVAGNNSGTNFLQENSSGVPAWAAGSPITLTGSPASTNCATFSGASTLTGTGDCIFASGALTLGAASTSSGVLNLKGSTSGTASVTSNATATTVTLGGALTQVQFPAGVVGTPILALSGDTTTGWYRNAANQWSFTASGTQTLQMGASLFGLASTTVVKNLTFGGNLTIQGGSDAAATAATGGPLTITAANVTSGATSAAVGGAITIHAGDNAATGTVETGGSITIRPGQVTSATPTTQTNGALAIQIVGIKGSTYNSGNLACYTALNTIGDCPTGVVTVSRHVGVLAAANGNSATVSYGGTATVNSTSSQTWGFGDFVCVDTTDGDSAVNSASTPCTAGLGVGIARGDAGAGTTHSITVILR